jgi:hypothetical protein
LGEMGSVSARYGSSIVFESRHLSKIKMGDISNEVANTL